MANPQLKQKPSPLEIRIKINPNCTPVPNGSLARLSRTEQNGKPSTVYWYAEKDCCISFSKATMGALFPVPTVLELDAGSYSVTYKLNPDYKGDSIKYNVVCSRPCPDKQVDNGESIIINP
jgi:hypothetical protein